MLDWIESHLVAAVVIGIVIAIAANVVVALALDALGIPWVFTLDRGVVMLLGRL